MEEGKTLMPVNFNIRKDINNRLVDICKHRGDKAHYMNLAIEYWLDREGEKVKKFNEKLEA